MKNLKFGTICVGLILLLAAAVSSVTAEARIQVEPRAGSRRGAMVLDGRGAQLGVMVSDVDSKATTVGAQIDEVNDDSPAEKAGIKSGDLIVEYDGERVRSARQFTRLVQETPEGRTVKIGLLREGKRQTVEATPETGARTLSFAPDVDRAMREAERGLREFNFKMPDLEWRFEQDRDNRQPRRFEYRLPGGVMPPINALRGRLGVTVQSLTPELEEYFGATTGGALVSSVSKDSAAAKAGVKAGDVITSINGTPVEDAGDLARALAHAKGDTTIVLLREKKEMTLKAMIEDDPRPEPRRPRAGSRPGI